MRSPKRSFTPRERSLAQGVAAMVGGGLGGAGCAGAAGLAGGTGLAGGFGVPPPSGGGAGEPPGFCSSGMVCPKEEDYMYHLRRRSVKLGEGVGAAFENLNDECEVLQFAAECRLIPRQESLRIAAMGRQFERAEVLPPRAVGHFGIGADPQPQGQQVVLTDLALMEPFDQMPLQANGKHLPTDLRHYSPKTSRTSWSRSCADSARPVVLW